jgi:hypothetical protein
MPAEFLLISFSLIVKCVIYIPGMKENSMPLVGFYYEKTFFQKLLGPSSLQK